MCKKHEVALHAVCGEMLCGLCFAEGMVEVKVGRKVAKVATKFVHKKVVKA